MSVCGSNPEEHIGQRCISLYISRKGGLAFLRLVYFTQSNSADILKVLVIGNFVSYEGGNIMLQGEENPVKTLTADHWRS
jgi:hypothetical protein